MSFSFVSPIDWIPVFKDTLEEAMQSAREMFERTEDLGIDDDVIVICESTPVAKVRRDGSQEMLDKDRISG